MIGPESVDLMNGISDLIGRNMRELISRSVCEGIARRRLSANQVSSSTESAGTLI